MPFGPGTINAAGSAVNDIFSSEATAAGLRLKAHGNRAEAQNYDLAAGLAETNKQFTENSTAIKETQAQRTLFKTLGGEEADVAGAGFASSGSALDIMADSASQGALNKAVLGQQGLITEAGFEEQAQSYRSMSEAANYAATEQDRQADQAITAGKRAAGFHAAAAIASIFEFPGIKIPGLK